jgi:GNAT superfamily N-acetyltransferase
MWGGPSGRGGVSRRQAGSRSRRRPRACPTLMTSSFPDAPPLPSSRECPRRRRRLLRHDALQSAVIFAGIELARRLDGVEARASARLVEARNRIQPDVGATWIEVAGAYALFDGPESHLTQTFGLGLFAEPASTDLERLEAFFEEHGAAVSHEVSPLAGVPVADLLCQRGYRPVEFTSVMYRPVAAVAAPLLETRLIAEGERDLWASVSARGWGHEFMLDLGRVIASADGGLCYLAFVEGKPVAAAVLRCGQGVALFGGASTIPEARRRGAQQALLDARMNEAARRGCELAMMCAAPGGASQRNAERQGFRIAYTRTKWQRVPPELR